MFAYYFSLFLSAQKVDDNNNKCKENEGLLSLLFSSVLVFWFCCTVHPRVWHLSCVTDVEGTAAMKALIPSNPHPSRDSHADCLSVQGCTAFPLRSVAAMRLMALSHYSAVIPAWCACREPLLHAAWQFFNLYRSCQLRCVCVCVLWVHVRRVRSRCVFARWLDAWYASSWATHFFVHRPLKDASSFAQSFKNQCEKQNKHEPNASHFTQSYSPHQLSDRQRPLQTSFHINPGSSFSFFFLRASLRWMTLQLNNSQSSGSLLFRSARCRYTWCLDTVELQTMVCVAPLLHNGSGGVAYCCCLQVISEILQPR